MTEERHDRPRHASFFSGVGGLDLGLERAGFRTVSLAEIEPFANAVLATRFPGVPNLGDVTTIDPDAIPDADLWSGGFPCQDLSVAGKRRGFGGDRSVLAFAFLDLVERRRPPWFILENVPGLLSSNGGADLLRLVREVADLGYGWAYRVLDARYFGVAQRRRRVFLVAGPDAERAAAVLSDRPGLQWHPAARGEAGEGPAAAPGGRAFGAGFGPVAGSLTVRYAKGVNTTMDDGAMVVANSTGAGWWNADDDATAALRAQPGGMPGHLAYAIQPAREAVGALTAHEVETSSAITPTEFVRSTDRGVRVVTYEAQPDGFALRGREEGNVPEPFYGVAPAIRGASGGSTQPFVFAKVHRAQSDEDFETWGPAEVAPTVNLFDQGDSRAVTLAVDEVASTLIAPRSGGLGPRGDGSDNLAVAGTLQASLGHHGHSSPRGDGGDNLVVDPVGVGVNGDDVARAFGAVGGGNDYGANKGNLAIESGVRRLTPVECERLMGWPDGWTIPATWRGKTYDGTDLLPVGLDSSRYRCCGNGVVSPVAEWIGRNLRNLGDGVQNR